jgi:acetolactate synthase-1/2/3 large subunit
MPFLRPSGRCAAADLDLPEPAPHERAAPSDNLLADAAREIARAKFPLIYAGGGVHLSDAHDELRAVAEQNNLPVMTSRGGKGALPDSHPLLFGALARRAGRLGEVYGEADLVLAVGTRLAIGGPSAEARVFQIDADPDEIGRFHKNTLALTGDAKATLSKLRDALDETGASSRTSPKEMVREIREHLDSPAERTEPQDSYMNAIREALPDDGIAILGMTQLGYYGRPFWRTPKARTFIDSGYSGNLGFAYPTALGAKVARPDAAVVCVSGDGGFGYHSPEMSTAVKYGINVVTVLFNDGAYGNVARDMDDAFGGSYEADLANPDYMKLADAYGVKGFRVDDVGDLKATVQEAIDTDQPALIEVPVGRMPRSAMLSTRPDWATPAAR